MVEQEGCDGLARDAALPARVQRLREYAIVQRGIQLVLLRYGVGNDQRRGGPPRVSPARITSATSSGVCTVQSTGSPELLR